MPLTANSQLRTIVPVWRAPASTCIQHYHLADYGGMGVSVKDSGSSVAVCPSKTYSESCLGAKMCAMPFLPPDPRWVSVAKSCNTFDTNSLQWKRSIRNYRRYVSESSSTKEELREMLMKLSSETNVLVDIPEFICRLAKLIPCGMTPEGKSIDEFQLHGSGGLHYHALSNSDSEGILFHCSGKSMETLVASKVDISNAGLMDTAFLKSGLSSSVCRTFRAKLYQITTQQSSQGIYCGLRHAKVINLGSVHTSEDNIAVNITDTKTSHAFITDLAFSPYIDGDYIYVTVDGIFYFYNMEMGINIHKQALLEPSNSDNEPKWWSCQFASHPRCVVFGNESIVLLRDLRAGLQQGSSLFSLNPDLTYAEEKLCTVRRSLHSSYLHYIGTSCSLNLVDERFPNYPVLTWKHQMQSTPVFCSLASYSSSSLSDLCEAVVLASHASKEVVLFNVEHQGTCKAVSLCPPLHISSPGDFVDTMLQNCYSIDPIIKLRTDVKLYGLDCISLHANRVTALQLTMAGDVFYQDFEVHKKEHGIPTELGHKQGPGYVACRLEEQFASRVLAWVEEAIMPLTNVANFTPDTKDNIDASRLIESLSGMPNHTHGCPLCCHCPELDGNRPDPRTVCAACGIDFSYGRRLTTVAEQQGVLAGSVPHTSDGQENAQNDQVLNELSSTDNLNNRNDPLLQRLLDVWTKEEPTSDIDQILPDLDSQRSTPSPGSGFSSAYGTSRSSVTIVEEENTVPPTDSVPLSSSQSSFWAVSSTSQESFQGRKDFEEPFYDSPCNMGIEEVSGPSGEMHWQMRSAKLSLSATKQSNLIKSKRPLKGRIEGF